MYTLYVSSQVANNFDNVENLVADVVGPFSFWWEEKEEEEEKSSAARCLQWWIYSEHSGCVCTDSSNNARIVRQRTRTHETRNWWGYSLFLFLPSYRTRLDSTLLCFMVVVADSLSPRLSHYNLLVPFLWKTHFSKLSKFRKKKIYYLLLVFNLNWAERTASRLSKSSSSSSS